MLWLPTHTRRRDLRADIYCLQAACRQEVAALVVRMRTGNAGNRVRGRVEALNNVIGWLGNLAARSEMLIDLAINVTDGIACLQQHVDDEQGNMTVRRGRRQRRKTCPPRREDARAQGRVSAYTDVQRRLMHLLMMHYPAEAFPPTLSAGRRSFDEWVDLVASAGVLPQEKQSGPVQQRLTDIATVLSNYQRVLVTLPAGQDHTRTLFACLKQLLSASISRLLVIPARAALKPHLVHAWSSENESWLSAWCPVQSHLTSPLVTPVVIASLREVQVAIGRREPVPPDAFDVLVFYGDPFISPMWSTLLEYFTVPHLYLCEVVDGALMVLCNHHILCPASEPEAPLPTREMPPISITL